MTVLEQINKEQDGEISIKELRDAINGGFFDKEENLHAVGELLNKTETLEDSDKELVDSLKATINNAINTILERGTIIEEEIILIKVGKELKLIGENEKLEELIIQYNSKKTKNEEILAQKFEGLNNAEKLCLSKKLNIGTNLISDIDLFLEKGYINLNFENQETINAVNSLNNLIKEDNEKHQLLEKIVNEETLKMSHSVNKDIANGGNKNFYGKEQIMLIQLRANVCNGENIIINGVRGKYNYTKLNNSDKEENTTNAYIYKLEILTRRDIIDNNIAGFKNLLEIPNLQDVLNQIQQKELQEKVWKEFLDVYLPIRKNGIYFENNVTGEKLYSLLQTMIFAEIYKDRPVSEEIYIRNLIKSAAGTGSQLYIESNDMINELQKFNTLGEYYESLITKKKEDITRGNNEKIDENNINYLNAELKKIVDKMNGLPKLCNSSTKQEFNQYKNEYKEIADDFILLRRNEKYRPYLVKNETLKIQIFTEIYSLWKNDGIDILFGQDIKNDIDDVINKLNSFSKEENEEIENINDRYYNTSNAEHNIEEGKGIRGEEHYDIQNEYSIFIPDEAFQDTLVGGMATGTYIYYTNHYDNYNGNGYNEHNGTCVAETEVKGMWNYGENNGQTINFNTGDQKIGINGIGNSIILPPTKTYHGYGTEEYNENVTIVGPKPDGWYAILPQELKDKSNSGQIKLAIIMGQPCVYEFTDTGDIKYWSYNKETKQLIFDKTITHEEYMRSITIESGRMKVWETDHGEEYKNIQQELNNIIEKNNAVSNLMNEFNEHDLDGTELQFLKKYSIQLYNMTKEFATQETRSKLLQLKDALKKLNQNSNEYENPFEKQIKEYIKNIDSILSFATDEQVQKTEKFMQLCCNNAIIHENDNRYDKTLQERITLAISFIVAIAATIVAIGSFGLGSPLAAGGWASFLAALGIGAFSAGTAMLANEVTQIAMDKGLGAWIDDKRGKGSIILNGKEYDLDYSNPTLFQLWLDENSEVTRKDVAKAYGTQFVTSTLIQAFCMWGGAEASNFISRLVLKSPAGSFTRKSSELVCKILCKENINSDMYTKGIMNNISKQVGKEGFMKKFSHELLEETREEGIEQAAESQGAVLGTVAMIIHCLKPNPGAAINIAGVSQNPDIIIPDGGKKIIINTTYDGSNPDNITMLKNYYEQLNGYNVVQEGDVLKVTKNGVSYTNDSGKNVEIIDSDKTIELEFRPSKAPLLIRSTPIEILNQGGININEKTGEIKYQTETGLMILSAYFKKNNLGIIETNGDGTAKIVTKNETIQLTQDLFDTNKGKENIIKLGEEIASIEGKIDEIKNEISKLSEGDTRKTELEEKKKKLEDQLKKSKKRKKSLETAIETVEQRNSQYDPEVLQKQIDAKKEKLSTMDETSEDYKELKKEIENLEKIQNSKIHEYLMNGEKLIEKASIRETLVLKLKKLKYELKNLYYNITNNTVKIEETNRKKSIENEIKNTEKEIQLLDKDMAEIIDTTYKGLRSLKGLDDIELRELTRNYYEKILKPIQFTLINASQTFESDIVNNEFQTQREISIEGNFEENQKMFSSIREKINRIRLGNYSTFKTMADIDAFIEENFGECPTEKQILLNLKKSLEENIGVDDKRMLVEERAVIFLNSVSYMLDFNEAYPGSSPNKVYNILDTNQNKLIHQHIQDKHYLTGSSHDVLHILRGNMNMAENYMGNMSARERVITRQIIIDHDMGYTSVFNKLLSEIRSDTFFDATKDHPLWSSQFIEDNAQRYIDNFGYDEYTIIKNSVTGHSKPDTVNLPTETETNTSNEPRSKQINAVISVVDCVAASADYKSAFLFSQPQIAGEFLGVYIDMNEGNIGNAIDGLHKIIETANTIQDPNLKGAIFDALNSLHLTDPATGEITLDKKMESIDGMEETEINKARDKLIEKLHDPKKGGKALSIFCKANGILDGTTVTDDNITPEQVKNYLKFDYINDRVSFPYEKYLSQYGVRVSVDSEGKTIIGETGGVVTATFELAGDSFETLLNIGKDNYDFKGKTVADFALASFLKVCDDMNINIEEDEDINTLKNHINNRVKSGNGKTIAEYLTEQYGQGYIVFTGKKGEKITLKFDGKCYEGFNQVMEFENKIDRLLRSENKFEAIENIRELFDSYTRIYESMGNIYMVDQQDLVSYLQDIQNKMNNISDSEMGPFIEEIANNIKKGYFTMSDNFVTKN